MNIERQLEDGSATDASKLYDSAPCGHVSLRPDGSIARCNETFLDWTGFSRQELLDCKRFQDLLPVAGKIFYDTHFNPLLLMQGHASELAFELRHKAGHRIPILLNAVLRRDQQEQAVQIDIALLQAKGRRAYEDELRLEKRRAESAEAALKQLTEQLEKEVAKRTRERESIWRISQDILVVGEISGRLLAVNPAFSHTLGWSEDAALQMTLPELVDSQHLEAVEQVLALLRNKEAVERTELLCRRSSGSDCWLSWTITPDGSQWFATARDVTEEKQHAEALRKAEEALRQSQKMEAIGKLTGGVAHDFNNILQVIGSNLELLKLSDVVNQCDNPHLQGAIAAVTRGADLVSQLLAFARRQPLKPLPTNLGRILRELDSLIRRAIGESIELETIVSGGLWTVLIDRSRLEHVVLNLAINARDAMAGRGKLTLGLGNAELDERYAEMHSDVSPGKYVMLAVTDTGCGMSPEVISRAFDPFFTTKSEGRGTGLGLSMVYGFVKQSGGHIKIYSEPGIGTTFRIYLPRTAGAELRVPEHQPRPVVGGSETILVVEDDSAVRKTAVEMLRHLGYRVLKSSNAQEALTVLHSGASVDLLFTDVVMPGPIHSMELAERAQMLMPDIRVLFTSGYTQNAIVRDGRLDPEVELLSKPYSREDLARRIRQLLGPGETRSKPVAALRILLVEDEVDSRQAVCELLEMMGHQVSAQASADTALEALQKDSYDVLLTDQNLPGRTGLELAAEVHARWPDINIVIASGHGDIQTPAFPSVCLPKPYNLSKLREVLQGCHSAGSVDRNSS